MRKRLLLGIALFFAIGLGCSDNGESPTIPDTVFGAITYGNGEIGVLFFRVNTVDFLRAAPSSPALTDPAFLATVPASGTVQLYPGGTKVTLTGTWDEGNNTLSISGSGTTVTGGYFVANEEVDGQVTWANGDIHQWQGLRGPGNWFCGTWDNGLGPVPFGFVIGNTTIEGIDASGSRVTGVATGNTLSFSVGGEQASGSATSNTASGTLQNGNTWSATQCL